MVVKSILMDLTYKNMKVFVEVSFVYPKRMLRKIDFFEGDVRRCAEGAR